MARQTMTAYDRKALVRHARATIARGSKSFAVASHLFDRETRERAWLLYAWCRACDDIADEQELGHLHALRMPLRAGQHSREEDAAEGLATIRSLTDHALAGRETGHPAFDALGQLAGEAPLDRAMIDAVIAGFALDAADWRPRTETDMLRYCYHVAGAVGVMMATVMGAPSDDEDTLARACDLGIAFQLANIVRDMADDDAIGRCYLPDEWLAEADIPPGELTKPHYRAALLPLVSRVCALARGYEASARTGVARLAPRQRWAVLAATRIYGGIARKVEQRGAHAWDHRVVVPAHEKLGHVLGALVQSARAAPPAARPGPGLADFIRSAAPEAAEHTG